MESIDTGDQIFDRRRAVAGPEGVEDTEGHVVRRDDADRRRGRVYAQPSDEVEDTEGHVVPGGGTGERRRGHVYAQPSDEVEDTEGHVFRTYPGVSPDEPPECRSPLPGDEEDRLGRI